MNSTLCGRILFFLLSYPINHLRFILWPFGGALTPRFVNH